MIYHLIVHGAAGRMGKNILRIAAADNNVKITAAVDSPQSPDIGKDIGTLAGTGPLGVKITSEINTTADAVIDFSLPKATDKLIEQCLQNNSPLVICTTGLTENHQKKLAQASAKIPILQASNTSIGMNTLFSLVGKVAKILGSEYDIEIIEQHHRYKKDAPSGSALTLAKHIAEQINAQYPDCLTNGRQGPDSIREKGEIGIHAVRAGDITGKHEIIYSTLGETIKITHNAHNRETFARGAVRAAKWLKDKPPALYTMLDCLGLA